jgi:transcriptional regulator GlxA family with amidase domain
MAEIVGDRSLLPSPRGTIMEPVRSRSIVFVVYPDLQGLDLDGPFEVFAAADEEVGGGAYVRTIAAVDDAPVRASSGLRIGVDRRLAAIEAPIDTLVVVGGNGTESAFFDDELIAQIRRLGARARRVTSVCSGSFLLAQAGFLDGKRATSHWSVCDQLAETFPDVRVDPEPIYVQDGNVYTSAGVTSGIDLALALVEEDLGRHVALAVARRFVLFLRRPGNQSQFSAQLAGQLASRDVIRDVQTFAIEHPGADLSVSALASRAAMSERHFARVFTREVGSTPARFVERARVEAARRRLEESTESVEAVAAACGFGTAETMRRTFLRLLRTTPSDYRRRFRAA